MRHTLITFPHIQLSPRDAHKLRGYIGTLFRERSPLLHNHLENGEGFRYAYPLVQYKVVNRIPMLVGVQEGAQLLVELFLQIKELNLDGSIYALRQKNVQCREVEAGYSEELFTYEFKTLWMALNQKNYEAYQLMDQAKRQNELQRLLRNHMLAAFKGCGIWLEPEQRILCQASLVQRSTKFKNQTMIAFTGSFTTNAILPPFIGLGKSVSRGFGTIQLKNQH